MNSNSTYKHHLKVLLLGQSGIGKTCVLLRFLKEELLPCEHVPTVSIEARSILQTIEAKSTLISVFDSPGNPRFNDVVRALWHSMTLIVFVASLADVESIEYVKEKHQLIFPEDSSDELNHVRKILILNQFEGEETEAAREAFMELANITHIKVVECNVWESTTCADYIMAALKETIKEIVIKEQNEKRVIKQSKRERLKRFFCRCWRSDGPLK